MQEQKSNCATSVRGKKRSRSSSVFAKPSQFTSALRGESARETKSSLAFKTFFLLQFTKELIKHSGASEVFELENILKEEKKELPKIIKEKIKVRKKLPLTYQKNKFIKSLPKPFTIKSKSEISMFPSQSSGKRNLPLMPLQKHRQSRIIRIPKPKLPPELQYLKPTPTNVQVDLGKLNLLIRDPVVKFIECDGADENIIVKGTMGTKRTDIILSKEEIAQVIKKFSETAKIPIYEGVFKVAVGKLILLAIISEVISSKFIIKKMMYSPNQIFRR